MPKMRLRYNKRRILKAQAKQSALWQPLKPQLDFDQFAKQLYQHRAGLLSTQDQALLQKRTMLR